MRYLDILESYRKDYKIPVTQFVEDVMSVHSYYRYLKGDTDIKVTQALKLLKKTDIDREAFYAYLSDISEPKSHDLETFIEHLVNGYQPRTHKAYLKLMAHHTLKDTYPYLKPYKLHHVDNQKTLFDQATDLLIRYHEYQMGLRTYEDFMTYLVLDPYMIDQQKHMYGLLILSLSHMFKDEIIPLDTLFSHAMQPKLYREYSWDLSFLVFQFLTHKKEPTYYDKHLLYEKYMVYTSKKLQGSLDIGFITHVYYHLCLLYSLKKDHEKQTYYAIRLFMTMKFRHDTIDQQEILSYLVSMGIDLETLKHYIQKEMELTLHERNELI